MVVGDEQRTLSVSGGHPVGTRHLPALGSVFAALLGAGPEPADRRLYQRCIRLNGRLHSSPTQQHHLAAPVWQ
jgi:hypothetical protein